jgi:hypothetical protein
MPVGRQRFDEAVLDDIFGQMMIAQALSGKGDEHLEILENGIFNAIHSGERSSREMRGKQSFGCDGADVDGATSLPDLR